MSRCFYALWPDPATRAALAAAAQQVACHGRPVDPANYHLTLVFLGKVRDGQLESLLRETSRLQARPFTLSLDQVGWWSGPRVLWFAPGFGPEPLLQLVTGLSGLARRQGIALEDRPYSPHLTVARKVRDCRELLALEPIRWQISDFCLLESRSLETGVVYKALASWPLTAAASV
ncbi:MAG TPA: RNA 2',3'-cyclic phosphodiesterase [Candidatus Glassbacteria bacterium]|nr:RNA 2',3'-cyclic phosphodiesterase [Candidatus Glassbacteria bacterium]